MSESVSQPSPPRQQVATSPSNSDAAVVRLDRLDVGQRLVYGGDKVTTVSAELAAAFTVGDRIVIDPTSGEILHIPAQVGLMADRAVAAAVTAVGPLAECSAAAVSTFFRAFARRLADQESFAPIEQANHADVAAAQERGRSVTRLILDDKMRDAMIAGLTGWAEYETTPDLALGTWDHTDWSVSAHRAPLGVVAFVFEGRPNVFADAAGVLRTGNTAVFRIGSDALGTAEAIMDHAVIPALDEAGLPRGAIELVRTTERAAGWAMFSNPAVALAVARGSGAAVAQLGAVARQSGLAVSLHGTGGAWLIIDPGAAPARVRDIVATSLDRKVCNTLNTVVVVSGCDDAIIDAVFDGLADAAPSGSIGRVHLTDGARTRVEAVIGQRLDRLVDVDRAGGRESEAFATRLEDDDLGIEWEWEQTPEISISVAASLDDAIDSFNRLSPRFVVSVVSQDRAAFERAYALLDAPFVGDGMTRWVDGQFALQKPELGLSNWQGGRMLGRGGILSGDGVYTIRYRAAIPASLRR